MARIIVTADSTNQREPRVLLDESLQSVHLSTGHAAMQLIERLGWAISDAEEAEQSRPARRARPAPQARRRVSGRQITARTA